GSVEAAPGTRTLQEEKTQMLKKLKGIGLLLITNFLIMIMLGVVYVVLANFVLPAFGIDIRGSVDGTILLYAGVLGFGGAFISLAFSKQFARAMLDCYQITEPRTRAEEVVFQTVRELAQRLHVKMPEVWVYDAPDPNALDRKSTRLNSSHGSSSYAVFCLKNKRKRTNPSGEMSKTCFQCNRLQNRASRPHISDRIVRAGHPIRHNVQERERGSPNGTTSTP